MKRFTLALISILITQQLSAKEIAFTFDDAPFHTTAHFKSLDRTKELIKKLQSLTFMSTHGEATSLSKSGLIRR